MKGNRQSRHHVSVDPSLTLILCSPISTLTGTDADIPQKEAERNVVVGFLMAISSGWLLTPITFMQWSFHPVGRHGRAAQIQVSGRGSGHLLPMPIQFSILRRRCFERNTESFLVCGNAFFVQRIDAYLSSHVDGTSHFTRQLQHGQQRMLVLIPHYYEK